MSSTIIAPNIYYKNYNEPTKMTFGMELAPIHPSKGDIVKLDATMLINILTSGNGAPASYNSAIVIERFTAIVPGSSPSTLTTLLSTNVIDTNLNNPSTTTPLTRLVHLSLIDIPPFDVFSHVALYRFYVTSTTSFNIDSIVYTNRLFSALVFHNN